MSSGRSLPFESLLAHTHFLFLLASLSSANLASTEPEILKQMIEHWVEYEAETGCVSPSCFRTTRD